MTLLPCPSCDRHVRDNARACPFCGGEMPPRPGRAHEAPLGLSRAAVLAFGAAIASSAALGCSDDTTEQTTQGSGGATGSGGTGDGQGGDGQGGDGVGGTAAGGNGGQGGEGGFGMGNGGFAQPYGAPPQDAA